MPNVYVNDAGTNKVSKQIFVKDAGTWKTVRAIWVKDGGTWKKAFPESSGSNTYTTGSGTFLVPNGITSLTVSYPTTTGIVTTAYGVTPGQTVAYNIGSYGYGSTFGSITTPAFDKVVATFAGNVDHTLYEVYGMGSTNGTSYSGTGTLATLSAGAAAQGIYYTEYGEGYHGDLVCSVSINTVPNSVLNSSMQAYISAFSGRHGGYISEQPSSANGYRTTMFLYDYYGSEGYYTYTMNLRMAVPITVSW